MAHTSSTLHWETLCWKITWNTGSGVYYIHCLFGLNRRRISLSNTRRKGRKISRNVQYKLKRHLTGDTKHWRQRHEKRSVNEMHVCDLCCYCDRKCVVIYFEIAKLNHWVQPSSVLGPHLVLCTLLSMYCSVLLNPSVCGVRRSLFW